MMRKIMLALAVVAVILVAGCTASQPESSSGQPICNKPYILVGTGCCLDQNDNSICDKDERQEASIITQAENSPVENKSEWCTQSQINFIKDPYVSVHSPRVLYLENSAESTTPVVATLSYEDSYQLPITGKIMLLSQLGVPPQHKITDLEYQIRVTNPDGSIAYTEPFALKEILTYDLASIRVYNIRDQLEIGKAGLVGFDSRLKYKIDGIEQTQCTPKNTLPFASSGSYSLPPVSNAKITPATSVTAAQAGAPNAQTNASFAYSGFAAPDSAELRALLATSPDKKVYFSGSNVQCSGGECYVLLSGTINLDTKEVLCSANALYYLRVSTGKASKNTILQIVPNDFLKKDFGGCPD